MLLSKHLQLVKGVFAYQYYSRAILLTLQLSMFAMIATPDMPALAHDAYTQCGVYYDPCMSVCSSLNSIA